MPQFLRDAVRWLGEGRLKLQETFVDGLENAPSAFIGMLKGENKGKMVVRVAE
jgi:NADPH-dependent curcumin reductase CurA